MSELKPCPVPWCTDPRPQVANITASCFVVRCNECQTKTPHFFTKAEAIEAWNTRAITSQGERIAMLEAALLNEIRNSNFCNQIVCAHPNGENCWCMEEYRAALAGEDK